LVFFLKFDIEERSPHVLARQLVTQSKTCI